MMKWTKCSDQLPDTEQTVERAMKIEAAMRQIVDVVQSTLDSEEKK